MQKIVSYQSQEELLQFSFVKSKFEIICPSISIADDIRLRLSQRNQFEIKIFAISNFLEYLKQKAQFDIKVCKKPDLMLELGAVWKIKFQDFPISIFFKAFQSVLGLRSFNLEMSFFDEISKEYDVRVAKTMRWFLAYIKQKKICDEHENYRAITNFIDDFPNRVQFLKKKKFLFLGFSHLSLAQIDFITSLREMCDIYIAIPDDILKKSKNSDWIKWIATDDKDFIFLKNSNQQKKSRLHYFVFPKGRMAEFYSGIVRKKNERQVFLGTRNPGYSEICEIPDEHLWFKISSEFLEIVVNTVNKELKDIILNSQDKNCSIANFIESIDKKIFIAIRNEEFGRFKILNEYKNTILSWKDLSEVNEYICESVFSIIEEVVNLRLPKAYDVPFSRENRFNIIQGIEGLWSFSSKKEGILCATSSYLNLNEEIHEHSEDANKILSSFGPIRNKTLSFKFIKFQIMEFLASKNSILFIEEGLVENNMLWNEIWREFDEKILVEGRGEKKINKIKGLIDPLAKLVKLDKQKIAKRDYSLTPSRLQLYLDCPRKFYFSVLGPVPRKDKLANALNAAELGEIQHRIIGQYLLKHKREFSTELHFKVCQEVINCFLKEREKAVGKLDYENYNLEIVSFTKSVIIELQKLYNIDSEGIFEFEVKLGNQVNGIIDCIFHSKKLGTGVLDFKRSSFSIPSVKDFEEKEKIQIWFYLSLLEKAQREKTFFGYVNLASSEESLIYTNNENTKASLEESYFMKSSYIKIFREDLEMHIDFFKESLKRYWTSLQKEKNFLAAPRNADVCKWCPVSISCLKGKNGSHIVENA